MDKTPQPQSRTTLRVNGRFVRSEMILRGVTAQDMANEMRVTRATIYNALNGKNTTLATVEEIASVLGVDALSILTTEPIAKKERADDDNT